MEPENPESGMDELMRLSQQFTRQEQERTEREKQRAEQRKKVNDVLGGLRDLKVSMAAEQLKHVTTPRMVERVNSLKAKPGTDELRRMISDLADDLESRIGEAAAADQVLEPLEKSMKTLTILIELFFSLQ